MGIVSERYSKASELILNMDKIPKLNIDDKIGSTHNIDFIKKNEVTEPIMAGVDKLKRNFLVFKLIIYNEVILQTIFQRYTDDLYTWRGCGHAT